MGEHADRIAKQIEHQRIELGENILELRHRAADAVDWRAQFEKRPMTMVGLAFGGGVLLSMWLEGREGVGQGAASSSHGSQAWANVKGALIGIAAAKLRSAMAEMLPAAFPDDTDSMTPAPIATGAPTPGAK